MGSRPITWHNVTAPDFSDASRMMDTAVNRMNTGFKGIGKAVNDYVETDKTNNTDALLARIQGAGNLNDYNQLVPDFSAEALNGQNVDALKLLKHFEDRKTTLQEAALAQDTYDQTQAEIGERDLVGRINTLKSQGNYKDALALANEAGGLRSTTRADLVQQIKDKQYDQVKRQREKQQHARSTWTHNQAVQQATHEQQLSDIVQNVTGNSLSEITANVHQLARDADVPYSMVVAAVDRFSKDYAQRTGITQEQQRNLDAANTAYTRKLQPEIDVAQTAYNKAEAGLTALKQRAGWALPDPEREGMSIGDLYVDTLAKDDITLGTVFDIEWDGGRDSFHENMEELLDEAAGFYLSKAKGESERERGFRRDRVEPQVVAEAMRRAGLVDYDDEDGVVRGEFDVKRVMRHLKQVYHERGQVLKDYAEYTDKLSKEKKNLDNYKQRIADRKNRNERAMINGNRLRNFNRK